MLRKGLESPRCCGKGLDFPAVIGYSKNMDNGFRTEQKVFTFIEKHRLLSPGERVVVGVSGGADSVCLLFVLAKWAGKNGGALHVVHVNHGIRADAAEDAAYVERLCAGLGIPFTLEERNVRAEAARCGRSEEEMGRIVRYEAFREAAKKAGADKIAVAHNADDQAETMLFHLFRGTGLTGLAGMCPERDRIIRPLLCLERREIEEYLACRGIAYCRDATNETDAYARNRIRRHILPFAEAEVSGGSVRHMARTALQLQEIDSYLEEQTRAAFRQVAGEKAGKGAERFKISCEAFRALPPVIARRLILRLLERLSPSHCDIAAAHVEDTFALFCKEGNGSLNLPYGICARKQYDTGCLMREREAEDGGECPRPDGEGAEQRERCESPAPRALPVTVDLSGIGDEETVIRISETESVCFRIFSFEKNQEIPKNQCTKWFDCDKINKLVTVRTRRTGDFLSIRGDGAPARQPLKRYMVNEKLPAEERDSVPLLADGAHILWVIGRRISEYYKVDRNTKRILQVQLKRLGEIPAGTEDKGWRNG